jgi:hypothetical protein
MGEYEWRQIVAYLESGQNLKQAVANADAKGLRKNNFTSQIRLDRIVPSREHFAWSEVQ